MPRITCSAKTARRIGLSDFSATARTLLSLWVRPVAKKREILAGPLITHHKAILLDLKPRFEVAWQFEFEPSENMQDAPNGERVLASKTELKFFGPDGRLLRT